MLSRLSDDSNGRRVSPIGNGLPSTNTRILVDGAKQRCGTLIRIRQNLSKMSISEAHRNLDAILARQELRPAQRTGSPGSSRNRVC
jgi:hypothetical protein